MKRDIHGHKERYEKWKSNVIEEGILKLTKKNSDIIIQHVFDMEIGVNISNKNKKGARSYPRLNNIRQRLSQLAVMLQKRGIEDITKITEKELMQFFSDIRSGIIRTKTGEVIKKQEFTGGSPERQLQEFVEKSIKGFFSCYLLKSFYKIPNGEIDTLAITEEGIPCIIEYKHKKEDTIINQINFYYDWLKQRSTKFEFERLVRENENTKELVVDWSNIRLICIAQEYSKWDISLIKHLDTDIECHTYTYHKDELDIHLDPIINQYKKQPYGERTPLIKEVTLEDHRNKSNEKGKKLLDKLRGKVLELGNDINEGFTPEYIKYVVNTAFLGVHVRKEWLIIQLRVNEDTFNDPKHLAKDISNRKWSVTREMKILNEEELNYSISLIKQAYDYQH